MKIGITGHRPERLNKRGKQVQKWLEETIGQISKNQSDVVLLCGMAQGVDQMAAFAALHNKIKLKCYFPYRHILKGVQEYLADRADEVRYECEKFQKTCYFKRDRRIVDDCDVLIVVWDGKKVGGTWYTYEYALKQGKDIILFPWKKQGLG